MIEKLTENSDWVIDSDILMIKQKINEMIDYINKHNEDLLGGYLIKRDPDE